MRKIHPARLGHTADWQPQTTIAEARLSTDSSGTVDAASAAHERQCAVDAGARDQGLTARPPTIPNLMRLSAVAAIASSRDRGLHPSTCSAFALVA